MQELRRQVTFQTIRAGVIGYLISWKLFFAITSGLSAARVFQAKKSENRTCALVLAFENTVRKQTQFLLRFCHHWFFYTRYMAVADSFSWFFSAFVEKLAFSPFFGHWPHFLALSRWFSGCPRCKETGASELIRCFAFRPFRPWTLHAFASFVEQIAFHSVRLELCGWNILAQQLVKHLCRCPNIVQSLSSVIYGWIFGQKEETKHQCQRVSLQCNIVLLMLRVL